MASLRPDCNKTNQAPMSSHCPGSQPGQWELTLRWSQSVETNQHVAVSVGQQSSDNNPLDATQRCCDILPGNNPQNSVLALGVNEEVPMETDQLEEALMMSSPVVKEALQRGVSPHLIEPKVRAKILSNKVGYTDVKELLADLL